MSSVDNRVVTMKFDNSQFQNGIKQTIASLEVLKEKLNLPESSALEKLNGKIPDLNPLAKAADVVANRFSVLGTIAFGALERIGSMAVDTGSRIVKALSIQPILDGFAEYETEMNSIKTIQANLPNVSNNDINKALAELNTYADKTVYSFGDMTRSIGLFTAAGVDLDKSVTAIKGMSNVAAGAGANNEALARANYQLSQALQSGTIKLMDWNSLVNAGMANPELQERLKQTAREMGKNVDAAIEKQGSFRDSLTEGWLTADVFLKTMALAADDTNEWGKRLTDAATKIYTFSQLVDTVKEAIGTGWGDSFRILIGDAVQARDMFTQLNDWISPIISRSADARNKVLKEWARFGGRDDIVGTQQNKIGALYNVLDGLSNIMSRVREGFQTAFPPITGLQLAHITHRLREASDAFKKFTLINGANIRDTFAGIFSVMHMGVTIIQSLANGFKTLLSAILPSAGNFLEFTATIGRFFTALDKSTSKTELFSRTINGFANTVATCIKNVKAAIFGAFSGIAFNFPNPFKNMSVAWASDASKTIYVFDSFKKALKSVFDFLGKVISDIGHSLNFGEAFKLLNNALGVMLTGGLVHTITGFVKGLKDSVEGFNEIKENIIGVFSDLRDVLATYQQRIKAKMLRDIAIGVGILAGSLFLLATVDPSRLTASIAAIAALMGILMAAIPIMERLSKTKSSSGSKGVFGGLIDSLGGGSSVATQLIKIAAAVAILAIALKTVASLSIEQIVAGLGALAAMLAMLVVSVKAMSSAEGKMLKGAGALIILGTAMNILAHAVKTLGSIDLEGLAKGVGGVGVILAMLAVFVNNVESKKLLGTSTALVIVGAAILELTRSVSILGGLDLASLAKGLGSIGILLGGMAAFTHLVKPQSFISTAIAMTIFGGAITILTNAVQILGSLDFGVLVKGLGSLGLMLGGLVLVTRTINPQGLVLVGAGLVIVAQAVAMLTESVIALGAIDTETLIKGLGAVGGLLAMLAVVTQVASKHVMRMLAFGASLTLIAGAISGLVAAVAVLGSLSYEELAKGLIGLGVALGEVAVACRMLGPLSILSAAGLAIAAGALGSIADAVGKFGEMTWEDLAKGLIGLGGALVVLGVAAAGMTAVIPGIIAIGLLGAAIGPLADGVQKISELDFMSTVGGLAALGVAIGAFVAAALLIEGTGAGIPLAALAVTLGVLGGGLWLASEAFQTFADMLNQDSDSFSDSVNNITENINTLTGAAGDIVVNFLNTLAEDMPRIVDAGARVVIGFIQGLTENISEIIDSAMKLIIAFIDGLADAIDNNHDQLFAAAGHLVMSIVNAIGDFIVKFVFPKGAEVISNICEGIGSALGRLWSSAGDIVHSICDGISGFLGDLWNKGCEIVNGIIGGIKSKFGEIRATAERIGSNIVNSVKGFLGIHSPSKVMHQLAVYCVEGFANGFADDSSAVDAAVDFAKNVHEAFSNSIDLGEAQPTIAPVFDMSNVYKGVSETKNLLNSLGNARVSFAPVLSAPSQYEQNQAQTEALQNAIADLSTKVSGDKTVNVNNRVQVYRSNEDWYSASTIFTRAAMASAEGVR